MMYKLIRAHTYSVPSLSGMQRVCVCVCVYEVRRLALLSVCKYNNPLLSTHKTFDVCFYVVASRTDIVQVYTTSTRLTHAETVHEICQ